MAMGGKGSCCSLLLTHTLDCLFWSCQLIRVHWHWFGKEFGDTFIALVFLGVRVHFCGSENWIRSRRNRPSTANMPLENVSLTNYGRMVSGFPPVTKWFSFNVNGNFPLFCANILLLFLFRDDSASQTSFELDRKKTLGSKNLFVLISTRENMT